MKKDASVLLKKKKNRPRNLMNVSFSIRWNSLPFNFHTDFSTLKSAQQGVIFRTAFRPHVFAHLGVTSTKCATNADTKRSVQESARRRIGGEVIRFVLVFDDLFSLPFFLFLT